MYLAIEIGGTKLQLAVGSAEGAPPAECIRFDVDPAAGAEGIRQQIADGAERLLARHAAGAVGVGFGGPVDTETGRTVTSHQIEGWDDFPLVRWCREQFNLPVALINDSDAAGLAEARFGAGQGGRVVFYTNVGSGIGGALVIEGKLYRGGGGIASEIGHLRPGPHCRTAEQTVEGVASGWAIAAAARTRATENRELPEAADLLARCEGDARRLNARLVGQAAEQGNALARKILEEACETYGWAVAQMITLLAPDIVVVGGGVALVGEALFLAPVRAAVDRYVFPPLLGSFALRPAALGEEVVLHGALAAAAEILEG